MQCRVSLLNRLREYYHKYQWWFALCRRDRLFVFFDQVHTTGTDVTQDCTAIAVVTLQAGVTFRDYSQACYRMRGLGVGQRVHVLVIDEIARLIMAQKILMPTEENPEILPVDVVAWLFENTSYSESIQRVALQQQVISQSWRSPALAMLLESRIDTPSKIVHEQSHSLQSSGLPEPQSMAVGEWSRFLDPADVSESVALRLIPLNLSDISFLRAQLGLRTDNAAGDELSSHLVRQQEGAPAERTALPNVFIDSGGAFAIQPHILSAACTSVFMESVNHEFSPSIGKSMSMRQQLAELFHTHLRVAQLSGDKMLACAGRILGIQPSARVDHAAPMPVAPQQENLDIDGVLLSKDAEHVQEQEQEQEQQLEVEEERRGKRRCQ